MKNNLPIEFFGHVLIRDKKTKEILVDKFNSINLENMSIALAYSMADMSTGHIQSMVFGNGGTIVSAVGTITYLPPNVTTNAALYNQTYSKVVNNQSPLDTNSAENYITINHTPGTLYSDIQVVCTLDFNEPSGQSAFDNSPVADGNVLNVNGTYIFDEIGLVTYNQLGNGSLLSHVIFHPVQKALNRSIEIIYTIRLILS